MDPTQASMQDWAQGAPMQGNVQSPGGNPQGMDMSGGQVPSAANPSGLMAAFQQLVPAYEKASAGLSDLASQEWDQMRAQKIKKMALEVDQMKLDRMREVQETSAQAQRFMTGAPV